MGKHKYEHGEAARYTYMRGYIEGQENWTDSPVISTKWYREKFRLSKPILAKDKRAFDSVFKNINWKK